MRCSILSYGFLAVLLFLVSCNNTPQNQQIRTLEDSVIAIHDMAMPYGDVITRYRKQLELLNIQLDSLHKVKPALDTAWVKRRATHLLFTFDSLDTSMNQWMEQYNPDFSRKTHKQTILYLASQKKAITTLLQAYQKAQSSSDKFLKELR